MICNGSEERILSVISIKLSPDWKCSPICRDGDYDPAEDFLLLPDELPLSEKLQAEIWEWADKFDTFLDWNNPKAHKFIEREVIVIFLMQGKDIVSRMQDELGGEYIVKLAPPSWLTKRTKANQ